MQIKNILRNLPSGYNRDVQETKEPLFRGCDTALAINNIMTLTMNSLETDESNLRQAFSPEIFATDAAFEGVMNGESFRDAYREVGLHLDSLTDRDASAALKKRTSTGTSGNPGFGKGREKLAAARSHLMEKKQRAEKAIKALIRFDVQLSPH
jgi:argininosuccinate lyase